MCVCVWSRVGSFVFKDVSVEATVYRGGRGLGASSSGARNSSSLWLHTIQGMVNLTSEVLLKKREPLFNDTFDATLQLNRSAMLTWHQTPKGDMTQKKTQQEKRMQRSSLSNAHSYKGPLPHPTFSIKATI